MDFSIARRISAADRRKIDEVRSDLQKTGNSPAMASALLAALMVDGNDLAGARKEICTVLDTLRTRDAVSEQHGDVISDIYRSMTGHSLQETIVRGMLDVAMRIAGRVSPFKIGERAGGVHAYLSELARNATQTSDTVIPLPLAA